MTGPDSRSAALRVSDAERDEAVQHLNRHHARGRLEVAEWNERVERALRAKTRGELDALFTDLPHPTPPAAGDPRRQRDGRNPRDGREPGSTRGGVDPYPYPAPALVPFRRAWFPAAAVLVVLTLIAVSAVTGRPVVFGAWPLVWLAFFVARRGRHYPHRLAVRRHGGRPC